MGQIACNSLSWLYSCCRAFSQKGHPPTFWRGGRKRGPREGSPATPWTWGPSHRQLKC